MFRASSLSNRTDGVPLDESGNKVLKDDQISREYSEEVDSAARSSGGPAGRTGSSKAIKLGDIEPEMLFERSRSDTPLDLKISSSKQVGQGKSPGKRCEEAKSGQTVGNGVIKKAAFAKPEPLRQEAGKQSLSLSVLSAAFWNYYWPCINIKHFFKIRVFCH